MRLGVSTKVFLAYAVLLTAFTGTSAFSVVYLHSTRQHVVVHNQLVEMHNAVESCLRQLTNFEQVGTVRPTLAGAFFENTRYSLEDARNKVQRFLDDNPDPRRRKEFEAYRQELAALLRAREETAYALASSFKDSPDEFKRKNHDLRLALDVLRNRIEVDSARVAEELSERQRGATKAAIALGIAGLLGAIGAAVSLWRTIRPLRELRLRAQKIASGDYGRRVGLDSNDEIGDLAREFNSMAQALQEREQRLIHSERLATVGKVAAQITHEIRNPLASLGLSAELLGDELGGEQREAHRLLGAISGEIDRLSEITESYLRFVRLPKPVTEREDPVALVTSVMEFARAELAQAGIKLELEAPAPVSEIAADENQIRQALLNLIRNAREAMPGGGRLRVTVTPAPPHHVRVAITDTGPGISAAHIQEIFEPFFSTKTSGTGLGLALVQQIVGEHGGEITVKSPAEPPLPGAGGPGTTFTIDLPAIDSAPCERAAALSATAPPSAGPTSEDAAALSVALVPEAARRGQ